MGKIAIRADRLSKRYKIGARRRHDTFRDHLVASLKGLVQRAGRHDSNRETIWALQDVSFEVEQGDIVGIIGRNGAGKSTLLKILSRIVEPTSGRAEIYGRVGSLLDVGTGFHPELSGRENIYLNASILGFRRREIERRFDEIVAFSGVEKFIETPVKHYSSGMYVRLAFAVAAHLDPEVLIVDEVLSVGDVAFQAKCLGKIGDVARSGRTVLFVSHNMGTLAGLCNGGIWLDQGRVLGQGEIETQVRAYLSAGTTDQATAVIASQSLSCEVRLRSITLSTADGTRTAEVDFRLPFRFEIIYRVTSRVTDLHIGIALGNDYGVRVLYTADRAYWAGRPLEPTEPGLYRTTVQIPGHLLVPGHYYVDAYADVPDVRTMHAAERCLSFTIIATGGVEAPSEGWGIVNPDLPWRTERVFEKDAGEIVEPVAATVAQ